MMEEINFSNCEVLVHGSEMNHHTLSYTSTVFIKIGDDYFYLQEDTEKLYDISKMPTYISEDWINYNKKEVTNFILEKWISIFSRTPELVESEYFVSELKVIKRDMKLRKLL